MKTRKGISAALLAIAGMLAVPACGVGSKSAPTRRPPPSTRPASVAAEAIDIDAAIDASKDEGKVIVYGNPSADQWEPVLEAFDEEYPWIEVETFDLGGAEAFQRYLTEEATGSGTADVIVNTDGAGWLDLIERGKVVDYVDPELADMPDFAVAAPGVFAMSVDPLIGIFNTKAFPEDEQPETLAELAEMAERPRRQDRHHRGRERPGRARHVRLHRGARRGGVGRAGRSSARTPRSRTGSGALLGKLQTGEYEAAFMASGSIRAFIDTTETGDVLNYRYLTDATPLPTRGMGVTTAGGVAERRQGARQLPPSQEGQTAGCAGGFTPYRDDVECPTGPGRHRGDRRRGQRPRGRLPRGARRPSCRRCASAGTRRSADDRRDRPGGGPAEAQLAAPPG